MSGASFGNAGGVLGKSGVFDRYGGASIRELGLDIDGVGISIHIRCEVAFTFVSNLALS